MAKKTKRILIVICSVVIIAGTFFCGYFVGKSGLDEDVKTISYIVNMYKKYYYEKSNDIVGLFEDALFDKYSEYYTKEEYDLVKKTAKGQREGVGFSYNKLTNEITAVLGNSPAKKAGLKTGGIIMGIGKDGMEVTNVSKENTVDKLLNEIPANTDFVFRVRYGDLLKDFTLQKREYTQTFVSYYDETGEYGFTDTDNGISFERLSDNVDFPLGEKTKTAVLVYSGFSGNSNGIEGSKKQFEIAMSRFKSTGKTCLILDLRDNGGGYMSILESVSAHLICAENGSKQVVSYAKYNDGKVSHFYSDKVDYHDYNFEKIIVLANENSASASEALMGAMLDYDDNKIVNVILEGSVVGDEKVYKSYGKGIMQSTFERITGEAIKLTTAKIYWPKTDISIHGVGLTSALDERILNESESGAFYDALSLSK